MDIYCHRCAEPWEPDSLHDAVEDGQAENYDDARRIFFSEGCGVLFSSRPCPKTNHPRAYLAAELAADTAMIGKGVQIDAGAVITAEGVTNIAGSRDV